MVVSVASRLAGLLLPAWNHCLTSWDKGGRPLSILSVLAQGGASIPLVEAEQKEGTITLGLYFTQDSASAIGSWGPDEEC